MLECISLMSKRHVQTEWPNLIPELTHYLALGNLANSRVALECIKRICKKYRFMFRSDALYNEMNYMIENLSPHLIQSLINATQQLILQHDSEGHIQLLTICNCVLHIIESILS